MIKHTKPVVKVIKLQIQAGKATPAPPVGPALGQAKVNIMAFCKEFNARTAGKSDVLPVVIYVYNDQSFAFETKQPAVPKLILKEIASEKGSAVPNRNKIGTLTSAQVRNIAEKKMEDMRANSIENAMRMVEGTARSMGVLTA